MAGASDKARYFLEQSIPELRELEKSKIFTKAEVTSVTRKRSDFEHKLCARGSKPADYVRYLEYEKNLESLRQKRSKRMGIKNKGNHIAQRRMLFIMDRATRKFHGDLDLWAQYFDVARRHKAYKKQSEILASMVRLHPTKPEVWTFAAKHTAEDQGNMTEARSYMQRGLRFCKSSRQLWLDCGKLELIYIAKVNARRRILGLDEPQKVSEIMVEDGQEADMLALPIVTVEDVHPDMRKSNVENDILPSIKSTPALTGAIPMAIFDAAMKLFDDEHFGGQFFTMVAGIPGVQCSQKILKHILDRLSEMAPLSPVTLDASIRLPLGGIEPFSSEFPRLLGPVLAKLKASLESHPTVQLTTRSMAWIVAYLEMDLDEAIRNVLESVFWRILNRYKELAQKTDQASINSTVPLLDRARATGVPGLYGDMETNLAR